MDLIRIAPYGCGFQTGPCPDSDPLEMVPRLLGPNTAGKLDVDDLVVPYRFEEINQAVADTASEAVVKAVLVR